MRNDSKTSYYKHPFFAPVVISMLFIILGSCLIFTGNSPTHDVIEIHGIAHYFYGSIARGLIPYWNPYSQTGTPFFTYYQGMGFLQPSQFVCILLQKFTGCTTFTTFIIHYLLMFYVFIVGTYYLLNLIIRHRPISLLFSLVLFLAISPASMRQDLLPFSFIPFLTFFLLLFFKESRPHKKGFYLLITNFLLAISLHRWIPIFLLFYLLLFIILAFLFRLSNLKANIRFLMSRQGILWMSLSIILIVLISSPIFALYYELSYHNESFPTVRFLQKNGNNLVKLYATDITEDILSQDFTNSVKISTTLGNLIGLVFEPFQPNFRIAESSEIVLYLSILPLIGLAIALVITKDHYAHLFFVIAGFILLFSCNFGTRVFDQPTFTQNIMLTLFPFLQMTDVLQNAGMLFLFCLTIPGAIGFQTMLKRKHKLLWIVPIMLPIYKYTVFSPIVLGHEFFIYQTLFLFGTLFLVALLFAMPIGDVIIRRFRNFDISRFQGAAVAILILDLLLFNGFHILYGNKVIKNQYFNYLQQENLIHQKREHPFINYRKPFSPSNPKQRFSTFYGHELYATEKAAFPNVVKAARSKLSGENYLAYWDHLYMTSYYYDYLVNVKQEKQLVTSNIISPILNFFPSERVIFAEDKYDVVGKINNLEFENLGTEIFIERDRTAHSPGLEISQFFNPAHFVRYTKGEMVSFDQKLHLRVPANPDVTLHITDYDINHLSLSVDTPYDGYVYFGDGYSKHWKARVDGEAATIEKTNINFKSVYTPAGRHTVDFVYDPVLYRYSLYLYGLGNLLFLIVFTTFLISNSRKYHKNPATMGNV